MVTRMERPAMARAEPIKCVTLLNFSPWYTGFPQFRRQTLWRLSHLEILEFHLHDRAGGRQGGLAVRIRAWQQACKVELCRLNLGGVKRGRLCALAARQ